MVQEEKRALTPADMDHLQTVFVTKYEFREEIDKLVTKEEFRENMDQIFTVLDSIVTELQEIRRENMGFHQRFERLEKFHS